MWLSRKKKPIFIPDPPQAATEAKMTAVEDNDNGNNNTNNNGGDNEMKLEPKSAAFVSNQPSRLSPPQQEQEQQREQQQSQPQQGQVYPYSVKIDQDSKGKAKISIHTYGVHPDATKDEAIRLFVKTQDELKGKGIAVLESTNEGV